MNNSLVFAYYTPLYATWTHRDHVNGMGYDGNSLSISKNKKLKHNLSNEFVITLLFTLPGISHLVKCNLIE